MRKIRKKILLVFLAGILTTMALLISSPTYAISAPKTVSIMGYPVGASGYLAYGLLGDAILQKFGTRLRAIPAGNDMARMINLRVGKTQFAGQGLDIYFSMYGLDRYAKREWGPLDLRAVWLARHSGWSIAARADSDIHKVQDLKGKKCGWIPGSVMNNGMEALLSYGGLSWDDVVKVQKSGYVVQVKALLDGSVDVSHGAVASPAFYEVASGPHGLRWLNLSPDDKEAIARVQKHLPMWTHATATIGANIDEKHALNCFTYAYPATLCMAGLNDEIAYFMTKAIHETYSIYAPKSKMMGNYWSLDVCLELIEKSHYLIIHPGSIRYLKEIGAWKPGWDEEQAKRIKLHKEVMDLWEEVLEESYAKEIKDKEFPKYWNEKRIAKFGF